MSWGQGEMARLRTRLVRCSDDVGDGYGYGDVESWEPSAQFVGLAS